MEQNIQLSQIEELLQQSTEEVCVHCDKEYKAMQLVEFVGKLGYEWLGGENLNERFWMQNKENTCYFFHPIKKYITYADLDYAKLNYYPIIYSLVEENSNLPNENQDYSDLVEHLNNFLSEHYPEQNFEIVQKQNQVVISGDTNLVINPDTEQISIGLDTNLELVNKIQTVLRHFKTPLYYVMVDIVDEYATNLPYLAKTKNGFEIVKQTVLSEYSLKDLLFTDAEYNELRANNPALTYNLLTVEYC